MATGSIPVFANACRTIREHRLLRTIDWYADCAGNPPSSSLHIDFRADATGFPQLSIDWKDTPTDVRSVAEHANALYHQRFIVADTTRKLSFGMAALAEYVIADHDGLICIEYHAESYFVRVGALGEQIVRLAALTLKLPNADEGGVRRLVHLIKATLPSIAGEVDTLRDAIGAVKVRRNEAAHESTFSDDRLTGLRGMLGPSAAFGLQPWEQLLEDARKYRTVFLEEAANEMTRVAERACALFEPLTSIVDGYSSAELGRRRETRESRGNG